MSDRTRCEECNEPFKTRGPEDGKRLAIWGVGMSGHNTSALLCAGCYARFKELGSGGMRPLQEQSSGHPALRTGLCLLCYKKSEGSLCTKCAQGSAEEHRGLAGAINRLRSAPCDHCAEESVGVVVFAGNGISPFCEQHARSYRSLDFIPALGFVKYGSVPHVVAGR